METYYAYYSFSDMYERGYSIHLMDSKENETFKTITGYKFLAEVQLPPVDHKEVVKAGVASIDLNIAKLQAEITQQEGKKQQLLAITHQEES